MDFQKLKKQIQDTRKLIETPIDGENAARASFEIRKNQAVTSLKELKILEKNMLHMHSNLYLVVGASEQVVSAFEKQGCLAVGHDFLAKKVAQRFWAQFTPGMTLNSFIVDQINQYMDHLSMEIGLDTYVRPRLVMQAAFQVAYQNEVEFAKGLESMFEAQLKNTASEEEAHVLQALISTADLMKRYDSMDRVAGNVNFIVSVPKLSPDLLQAYKGLLSTNVYTATFKTDLELDEKKITDTVKAVLKKKEI